MDINEDKLFEELDKLRYNLMRNQSLNNIINNYKVFQSLNYVLMTLSGCYVDDSDLIYRDSREVYEYVDKYNDRQLNDYYDRVINEGDYLYYLFMSFSDILKESNYIPVFNTNIKTYTEDEAKDIMLTYFKQFGSKIYSIAETYINERISTDVELDPGFGGLFIRSASELGYILIPYNKYIAVTMSAIVHEIGHAIDNNLFEYPQQKKLSLSSQFLVEVPSTFFELNFLEYLIDNKIDVKGANYAIAERLNLIKYYAEQFEKYYEIEDREYNAYLTADRQIIDPKTQEVIDLDGALLYGFGYMFSFNLNSLYKEDKKLTMKKLMNLICGRNETSLSEEIEKLGFDENEFLSLKRPKEKIKQFIKKYNEGFNIYE